jgi:uncharacterized membrane protein YqjE
MPSSLPPPAGNGFEEGPGRRWGERLADLTATAQSLVATRLAIFEAEAGVKAGFFGKGLAGTAIAAAFAFAATLLLAALLAAVLAQVFGNAALGILGAMVVYLAVAGGAGWFAWKSFSQVKPTEFPATRGELARDMDAIRAALAQDPHPDEGPSPDDFSPDDDRPDDRRGDEDPEGEVRDLEARLRAGAE